MEYYPAFICENGHAIETTATSCDIKHCSQCSAPVIHSCPSCGAQIKGHEYGASGSYAVPFYCWYCGKEYPWTESAITSAAHILAGEENLTAEECNRLIEVLPDVISETPKTNLAATRLRKAFAFMSDIAKSAIGEFVIKYGCNLIRTLLDL